jgi:hypothetical protein
MCVQLALGGRSRGVVRLYARMLVRRLNIPSPRFCACAYLCSQVPTIYEAPVSGLTTWTNQFSFTERFRPLATHLGGHQAAADKQHEDHNKHGSARHMPVATTVRLKHIGRACAPRTERGAHRPRLATRASTRRVAVARGSL